MLPARTSIHIIRNTICATTRRSNTPHSFTTPPITIATNPHPRYAPHLTTTTTSRTASPYNQQQRSTFDLSGAALSRNLKDQQEELAFQQRERNEKLAHLFPDLLYDPNTDATRAAVNAALRAERRAKRKAEKQKEFEQLLAKKKERQERRRRERLEAEGFDPDAVEETKMLKEFVTTRGKRGLGLKERQGPPSEQQQQQQKYKDTTQTSSSSQQQQQQQIDETQSLQPPQPPPPLDPFRKRYYIDPIAAPNEYQRIAKLSNRDVQRLQTEFEIKLELQKTVDGLKDQDVEKYYNMRLNQVDFVARVGQRQQQPQQIQPNNITPADTNPTINTSTPHQINTPLTYPRGEDFAAQKQKEYITKMMAEHGINPTTYHPKPVTEQTRRDAILRDQVEQIMSMTVENVRHKVQTPESRLALVPTKYKMRKEVAEMKRQDEALPSINVLLQRYDQKKADEALLLAKPKPPSQHHQQQQQTPHTNPNNYYNNQQQQHQQQQHRHHHQQQNGMYKGHSLNDNIDYDAKTQRILDTLSPWLKK